MRIFEDSYIHLTRSVVTGNNPLYTAETYLHIHVFMEKIDDNAKPNAHQNLARKWGLKRGEGGCSKMAYFGEHTVLACTYTLGFS